MRKHTVLDVYVCICVLGSMPGVLIFEMFLGVGTWSCFSWVGVLFFGVCCPVWILCKCGICGVPGKEYVCVGGVVVT